MWPGTVESAPRWPYQRGMATMPTPTPRHGAQVLVVDDEPGVASFVARGLRAKGFAVDTASGGAEALDMIGERRYELVLLDLRMPGVNGVVVLKQLMRRRPELKVMVVSAAADTQIKVRCLELGAADFLAKPFELAELVARVGAHVRRAAQGSGAAVAEDTVLRAGELALDLERRSVDCGEGAVALSSREFLLLRHLMRRAGRPCTREELLDEVWDTPFDTGTNVVDVYVHRLRHKLGAGAIETVRNVGYRLVLA
jgi:two-component system, OmpR family, response regulator